MFRKKKEANEILRYAIKMLRGGCCRCPQHVRISLICGLNNDLLKMGAVWQSKRLLNHLHRAFGSVILQQKKGV